MKTRFISILSLLLILTMCFTSCGGTNPPANGDDTVTSGSNNDAPATEEVVDVIAPYTITETLFPADLTKEVYEIFTTGKGITFKGPVPADAPFVMGNANGISDCRLLSMTIPVYKTGALDANGDFIFTLFVYDMGFKALKGEPKATYEIKINAEANGLTPNKNSVKKVVKVDLTSYNINIGSNESIGYYKSTDTLVPAYLGSVVGSSNSALNLVREKAPENVGCYAKVGTADMTASHDTFVIDFEWEKTYESNIKYLNDKNSYDKMINELKTKYKGKYLSIIGDSISSFDGVCNDGKANVTIANNADYYPTYAANVYDPSLMYWGKVIKDLEMNTCVINGWSASAATGTSKIAVNMLERATELHRDGGTPDNPADDIAPDVILIYFGINDLNGGAQSDATLVGLLNKAKDSASRKTAVENWFKGVKEKADKSGSTKKGEAFDNFEQVYALSLNAMREKYPNAEIYCLTYQENNHNNTSRSKLAKFTQSVSALAEYFGATVVDQSKDEITATNCHAYAADNSSLHPNPKGHAVMAKSIVTEMYNNNK
ncbi:MAG: SGNH/GDSL hydrolase family protein [Clostridia bacterium]|nr:SGNH/GDSL hydrolase family protein [Clostridia bacterium]